MRKLSQSSLWEKKKKKEVIFVSDPGSRNKMEKTHSWARLGLYLQNKMSFQWEDLCQVWKLSYSSVTNAPREKHNSHLQEKRWPEWMQQEANWVGTSLTMH